MTCANDDIFDWVESTVKLLVKYPDEVHIELVEGNNVNVISCQVATEDKGVVIGARGIMADAIRVVLNAFGAKNGKKYLLHING